MTNPFPKSLVSSTIYISSNLFNLFLIFSSLQIFSSLVSTFVDVVLRKSRYYACSPGAFQEKQKLKPLIPISKFHFLIHEPNSKDHYSFQKLAIFGTSCLFVPSLDLTTCLLFSLKSISLALFPSSLIHSLSSPVRVLHMPSGPFP